MTTIDQFGPVPSDCVSDPGGSQRGDSSNEGYGGPIGPPMTENDALTAGTDDRASSAVSLDDASARDEQRFILFEAANRGALASPASSHLLLEEAKSGRADAIAGVPMAAAAAGLMEGLPPFGVMPIFGGAVVGFDNSASASDVAVALPARVTASSAYSLTGSTVTASGGGLVFNNTFDTSVSAAFVNCIDAAERDLASRFTASLTLNLDFRAEQDGTNGTFLAYNQQQFNVYVNYSTLRSKLAPFASLPAVDPNPIGGDDWALPEAYARMLNLSSSTPAIDDTVVLNTSYGWNYGQDVINVVEHEISEGGMGRIGSLGDHLTGIFMAMDLFRYASPGVHDYSDGRDFQSTYFSSDGSNLSSLSFFNDYFGGVPVSNPADTADFAEPDVFGTGSPGETNTLSQTDIAVMDALGWNPSSGPSVSFSVSPASGEEGDVLTFRISIQNPNYSAVPDYLIYYDTSNGTATAGGDYQATSGHVDFTSASPQFFDIAVPTFTDGDEPSQESENFSFSIYDNTHVNQLGQAQGMISDARAGDFTVSTPATAVEGSILVFRIAIQNPNYAQTPDYKIYYDTSDGTATQGTDYQAVHSFVDFTSSSSQFFDIAVHTTTDSDEPSANSEFFNLNVYDSTHNVQLAQAAGTITDGLIDFEDLSPGAGSAIPAGYQGFDWNAGSTSLSALNTTQQPNGGYLAMSNALGGSIVAFDPYDSTIGQIQEPIDIHRIDNSPFAFRSVYLASAWDQSQQVLLTGYDSQGNVVGTNTVDVNNLNPLLVSVDWAEITDLKITHTRLIGPPPNSIGTHDQLVIDDFAWSATATLPPVVSAQNVSVGANQAIAASSMFSANDSDGDNITQYAFYDVGGDGGFFAVNGIWHPDGQWISVAAASLGSVSYVGGPSSGSETLYVSAYDGTQWASSHAVLTATTTTPSVSAHNVSVGANQPIAASSMFSASDPDGDNISQYAFYDAGGDGGFFSVNGAWHPDGQWISVAASNLGSVSYVGGPTAGSEALYVSAYDGFQWSSSHAVLTAATTTPVVSAHNVSVGANQAIAASSMVSASDPDGDSITQYAFYDAGGDGGYFKVNGAWHPDGQWIIVSASNLGGVSYVGGPSGGSETLYVSASDGFAWASSHAALTATTNPPAGQALNMSFTFSDTSGVAAPPSNADAPGAGIAPLSQGDSGAPLLLLPNDATPMTDSAQLNHAQFG